jgi:hypothetical protein
MDQRNERHGTMCAERCPRPRSGDRIAIAAYLGEDDAFDRAIGSFAEAYADQNDRDYAVFKGAVEGGRLMAEVGV